MDIWISHPYTRAQDGNRLYTYERQKAGCKLGAIGMPPVRRIGDYLVAQKLFVVHEENMSWRFDPYGGSLDSTGAVANVGSPCVCALCKP